MALTATERLQQKTQFTTLRRSLDCHLPSLSVDPSPYPLRKYLLAKLAERDWSLAGRLPPISTHSALKYRGPCSILGCVSPLTKTPEFKFACALLQKPFVFPQNAFEHRVDFLKILVAGVLVSIVIRGGLVVSDSPVPGPRRGRGRKGMERVSLEILQLGLGRG